MQSPSAGVGAKAPSAASGVSQRGRSRQRSPAHAAELSAAKRGPSRDTSAASSCTSAASALPKRRRTPPTSPARPRAQRAAKAPREGADLEAQPDEQPDLGASPKRAAPRAPPLAPSDSRLTATTPPPRVGQPMAPQLACAFGHAGRGSDHQRTCYMPPGRYDPRLPC